MRQFLFIGLLALATTASGGPWVSTAIAASPSSSERRITEYVDAHNSEALALLEHVVNINSGTMNSDGVREVGRVLAKELDDLGFTTRWVDGAAFERAGHLVAKRRGKGPRLLLIGHLDTVFEADGPFQKYEDLPDGRAQGPGVIDMKGGDVIIVYALRALSAVDALDDLDLTVVMTGDEERPGRPISAGREALLDIAKHTDIALAFENGDNDVETAVTARRGFTGWRLTVTGKASHSANLFKEEIGAGAIYEAARILDRFYEDLAGEEYLTFNPGLILGGTDVELDTLQARGNAFGKSNIIATDAVVTGDLRALSIEQRERAKQAMRHIVADSHPHTSARIVFDDGYPPMAPSDGNRRLLAMFDRVSQDLGFGPVRETDPGRAGAADVAFAALHVGMAIDGIGLVGSGEHTEAETADLGTMPLQTKRAAVLMYRLSRQ
jgi:glutamate carboxypeptidase